MHYNSQLPVIKLIKLYLLIHSSIHTFVSVQPTGTGSFFNRSPRLQIALKGDPLAYGSPVLNPTIPVRYTLVEDTITNHCIS